MDLRGIEQYKNTIKQEKFVGILFRPRELLHERGLPFMFLTLDCSNKTFSKLIYKGGLDVATSSFVNLNEIEVT
jgi:hypothetical protein